MDKDEYVYCTECRHFKVDNNDDPKCKYENECDLWDCEDSRRYGERPKYEPINYKRVRLLKNTAYNSEGDILRIVEETDGEIYYYDSFRRWCYLDKVKDADCFEYMN